MHNGIRADRAMKGDCIEFLHRTSIQQLAMHITASGSRPQKNFAVPALRSCIPQEQIACPSRLPGAVKLLQLHTEAGRLFLLLPAESLLKIRSVFATSSLRQRRSCKE